MAWCCLIAAGRRLAFFVSKQIVKDFFEVQGQNYYNQHFQVPHCAYLQHRDT